MAKKGNKRIYGIAGCVALTVILYQQNLSSAFNREKTIELRNYLSRAIQKGKSWPKKFKFEDKKLAINYSLDSNLEKYIQKKLKRYQSDYSSVIVLDNNTADILAAVSYQRGKESFDRSLAFSTTHPSASLFKIITSAALLESGKIDEEQIFSYRGKGSTLYRYQLKDKVTPWTRYRSFAKAFASSNNVIFGKAVQRYGDFESIRQMANKFGFNRPILQEVAVSSAPVMAVKDGYQLAELATGFNRKTMMSPVHGALLSLVVANDGVIKYPRLVESVVDSESNELFWTGEPIAKEKAIVSEDVAAKLRGMMRLAIDKGTARSSFRRMRRSLKQRLEMGGKTGSITGGIPKGKHDWFTFFAYPKDSEEDRGISICVLNINVDKWRVKAPYLAKEIVSYYYQRQKSNEKKSL